MARRKISHQQGIAAVQAVIRSGALGSGGGAGAAGSGGPVGSGGGVDPTAPPAAAPTRQELATATRYLLEELAAVVPGATVEVRVPPFGAVQCVAGPRHTRGTPPNTVEMDPLTWIAVATGLSAWGDGVQNAKIRMSGVRADISEVLPLVSAERLRGV